MTSCPHYQDDPSIPDTAIIWRRIHEGDSEPDEQRQCERITSAAFSPSSEDSAISVSLADEAGPPEEYLKNPKFKEKYLASFPAKLIRKQELGIIRQATDDDPAHALIVGNITRGKRRAFGKHSSWVIGPENGCPAIPID
jgi:hypothetical protein